MTIKKSIYCFLLSLPGILHGQSLDTAAVLRQLVSNMKSFKSLGYDFVVDAKFPNGEKDHIKGETYADIDKQFLYNNCDAFTMVYTAHWYYNADHRKKIVTIVDLDSKNYNKKQKKALKRDILQGGELFTFLDSIVLKTAIIKKIKQDGNISSISLGFPKAMQIEALDMVYDNKNNFPVSYSMSQLRPMQKTAKGIEGAETTIKCSNFKKVTDLSIYDESNFFSYTKGKIKLKKYTNYKRSTKM